MMDIIIIMVLIAVKHKSTLNIIHETSFCYSGTSEQGLGTRWEQCYTFACFVLHTREVVIFLHEVCNVLKLASWL